MKRHKIATARVHQRVLVFACLLGGLFPAVSCRCHDETLSPIDISGAQTALDVNGADLLAPPWEAPMQASLENGLLIHWLEEKQSPAFHLRLLFPTTTRSDHLDAARIMVTLQAIETELSRRFRPLRATFEISSRAGRVEIAIHGPREEAKDILALLSTTFKEGIERRRLAHAQGKVFARTQRRSASDVAAAHLTAGLLGLPLEHELVDPETVKGLDKAAIERAFWTLTDPRDAIAIIHTGRPYEELREELAKLGHAWRSRQRLRLSTLGAFERLRGVRAGPQDPTQDAENGAQLGPLLEGPKLPLKVASEAFASSKKPAMIMIGRRLPAATAEDRAMARLSQRMLQERLDARLVISGSTAILLIRVRLSRAHPVSNIEKAVDTLVAHATGDDPPERLRQAADLWLGARIVDASLNGEDWTSLWSESLDLAQSEQELAVALAVDAKTLLKLEPAEVQAWRKQWFHPSTDGWHWVIAGADAKLLAKIEGTIPLQRGP